jgi:hypothetical protein
MQTIIKHGTDFASLHVTFDAPGESLRCEAGAMVARDVALDKKTNMPRSSARCSAARACSRTPSPPPRPARR